MFAIWGREEVGDPQGGGLPDVMIHAVMTFHDGAPSYEAVLELVTTKLLCHKRWLPTPLRHRRPLSHEHNKATAAMSCCLPVHLASLDGQVRPGSAQAPAADLQVLPADWLHQTRRTGVGALSGAGWPSLLILCHAAQRWN